MPGFKARVIITGGVYLMTNQQAIRHMGSSDLEVHDLARFCESEVRRVRKRALHLASMHLVEIQKWGAAEQLLARRVIRGVQRNHGASLSDLCAPVPAAFVRACAWALSCKGSSRGKLEGKLRRALRESQYAKSARKADVRLSA